jgi:hypothetical protein
MYHRTVNNLREATSLPGPDLWPTPKPIDVVEVPVDTGEVGLRAVHLSSDDYPTRSPISAAINCGGSAILATTPASGSTYRGGSFPLEHKPKTRPPSPKAAAQHPDEPTRDVGLPAPVRHRIAAAAAPRERRERRSSRPSRAGPKSDDDGPEPPRRPLEPRYEARVWLARRSRELRALQEQERSPDTDEIQLSFGEVAA